MFHDGDAMVAAAAMAIWAAVNLKLLNAIRNLVLELSFLFDFFGWSRALGIARRSECFGRVPFFSSFRF
jgi:hypothetical protein